MCLNFTVFAVSAVAVVLGISVPCTGQALVWRSLSTAPPALIQVYRAKDVSDPPPTLKDVQGAQFVRIMEPGQSVPLFLVDPNQENLEGSGGLSLIGYIPQGCCYKQVLYVYSQRSSIVYAANVKAGRKIAENGGVAIFRQQEHGVPLLFFPAAGLHMPMHLWRFNGKEYR